MRFLLSKSVPELDPGAVLADFVLVEYIVDRVADVLVEL